MPGTFTREQVDDLKLLIKTMLNTSHPMILTLEEPNWVCPGGNKFVEVSPDPVKLSYLKNVERLIINGKEETTKQVAEETSL